MDTEEVKNQEFEAGDESIELQAQEDEQQEEFLPEEAAADISTQSEEDSEAEEYSIVPADGITGKFILKERYEIDFSSRLSWLDNNSAAAYTVTDRIDASRKLFALICSKDQAPRLSLLSFLKSADIPHLMKLTDYGVVEYPATKTNAMALIYVMPQGGKVFVNGTSIINNLSPELFKNTILGLLGIIENLKGHGITHRAVRADNLYFKDINKTEIVLGDCAAAFPATHQPPAFETIENLYATVSARGDGTDKDDIYAAGVTALCLATGIELKMDIPAAEMMYQKIKKGSFVLLSEKLKVPTAYVQIIKGLLHDLPENRWGYTQTYAALEGKAQAPSSQTVQEKNKRALTIGGEKYYTAHEIVHALYGNIPEAYEMTISGKITEWAKNVLENEKLRTKIETIVGQASIGAPDKDMIVAKICITIAPNFPIRYKDITFFPNGLPKCIFLHIKEQKPLKLFMDIFNSDLIKIWYQEQEKLRSPANATEFRSYINRRDIGYGLERIIYDFDDDLPCISPLLGNEFVDSPASLLRALNNSYSDQLREMQPYDRMIAAYLRCKIGKKTENIIVDLNSARPEIKASAILHMYSNIQNKHGPAILTNLAKWLAYFSRPIIQIYHNKHHQKHLERDLMKVYKKGRIFEILSLLENEDALYKDKMDYTAALSEANTLIMEKNKYLAYDERMDAGIRETAIRAISAFAVFVMLASFGYNLMTWVMQ